MRAWKGGDYVLDEGQEGVVIYNKGPPTPKVVAEEVPVLWITFLIKTLTIHNVTRGCSLCAIRGQHWINGGSQWDIPHCKDTSKHNENRKEEVSRALHYVEGVLFPHPRPPPNAPNGYVGFRHVYVIGEAWETWALNKDPQGAGA